MHIWEDYYIVEVVDPQTLEPVPDGEVGELVLTTINPRSYAVVALPHPRFDPYFTGDCPCGRHHKRLDRMKGRSDDMMILKGVNIFPIQIETVLMQFEELGTDYLNNPDQRRGQRLDDGGSGVEGIQRRLPALAALTR